MTTRAVPNADARKDLRVITAPDGRILSDQRNRQPSSTITTPKPLSSPTASYTQQPQKPSSVSKVPKPRQIVRGPKPK